MHHHIKASARFVSIVSRFGPANFVPAAMPDAAATSDGSGAPTRRLRLLLATFALALCALGSSAPSALALPVVSIDSSPTYAYTTAKVSGEIDPAGPGSPTGPGTYYTFEYSSDGGATWSGFNYEGSVEGVGNQLVRPQPGGAEQLTGLTPNTHYEVRLAALNFEDSEGNPVYSAGPNPEFTTLGAIPPTAPTLVVDPASEVKYTSAHLSGTVDPEGGNDDTAGDPLPFHWELQYSQNPAEFGWAPVATGDISGSEAGESTPIVVQGDATGLANHTEYKTRLVVIYAGQEAIEEGDFETQTVSPPNVAIDSASLITGTTAHLSGHVTPGNEDAAFDSTCAFEYITDAGFQDRQEVQRLQIKATGGTYTLSFKGETTAPIAFDAPSSEVQAALEALPVIGSGGIALAGGPGEAAGANPYLFTFATPADVEQLSVDGSNLTLPGAAQAITVKSGNEVLGNDEVQKILFTINRNVGQFLEVVDTATGGTYTIGIEDQQTGPLAFDADAATIQSALEGLPLIGPGNVIVTGSDPSTISFTGALAKTNVPQLTIDPSALTVSGSASTQTDTEGHTEGFDGAKTADCDPNPVTGGGETDVIADITGLQPHTTYHLRLKAFNQGGTAFATGANFATEAVAPSIPETSVTDVTTNSATLHAQLNPGGEETTYHFEYSTLADYEAASGSFAGATPTPEATLPETDDQAHPVTAPITGLAPDTAYRFRVVAENSKAPSGFASEVRGFKTASTPVIEPEDCDNKAVRAQQGSTHLPGCRAYEMVSSPDLVQGDANRVPWASDDGENVVYMTTTPGEDAAGGGLAASIAAQRTSTGWASFGADPHALGTAGNSTGATMPLTFTEDLSRGLFGTTLPIDPADDNQGYDYYGIDYRNGRTVRFTQGLIGNALPIGASSDLDRFVFLSKGDVSSRGLYVSDGSGPAKKLAVPAGEQLMEVGTQHSRGLGIDTDRAASTWIEHRGPHGVSDDARRIYFANVLNSAPFLLLYDETGDSGVVRSLGRSRRASDPEAVYSSRFIAASHDGSIAYFVAAGRITDSAADQRGIYQYDADSDSVQYLIGLGGGELGAAMASDDMSHLYFVATSALLPGALDGAQNSYVWSPDHGLRFLGSDLGALRRVSPNGEFALWVSSASLGDAPNNGHFAVYEYDYSTDELNCVSCRPDGTPSQGHAGIEGDSGGFPRGATRGRALMNDGRVFFASSDRLVSRDQGSMSDVYLYDHGKLSLISSGNGVSDAYYGDSSDDGKHVFIYTREALVGADRDAGELDVYDVHTDGGFLEPPPPPAECEGEACRRETSEQADPSQPTTPGFIGAPNPPRCPKGKVRRNGRCVKHRKPAKHRGGKRAGKGTHKRHSNTNRGAAQ